jgi:hypothetical protein
MTIAEAIDRLRQAKAEIVRDRERDVLRIALDQVALMKLRVQGTGIQDNLLPFAPYSPSYAKERASRGYQIGFVDYTRTGQMFASVTPRVTESSVFTATVVIESNNERGQTIIRAAFRRNGRLLTANSKAELEQVRRWNRQRILSKLRF